MAVWPLGPPLSAHLCRGLSALQLCFWTTPSTSWRFRMPTGAAACRSPMALPWPVPLRKTSCNCRPITFSAIAISDFSATWGKSRFPHSVGAQLLVSTPVKTFPLLLFLYLHLYLSSFRPCPLVVVGISHYAYPSADRVNSAMALWRSPIWEGRHLYFHEGGRFLRARSLPHR